MGSRAFLRCVLGVIGILGLAACGGGGSDPPGTGEPAPPPGHPNDPSEESPPPSSTSTTPPTPKTPVAIDKTFERAPGASVTGKLEAQGASPVTFEIVTPPKNGRVGFIDAASGEFLYRPNTLTSAVADELGYVAKADGQTSAVAKVTIGIKPLDFAGAIIVKDAVNDWYSYNLAANFNNSGDSPCGAQQPLTIAGGKLAERAWSCGTFPEIAVTVSATGISGSINSGGGSFRRVRVQRKQLDARLEYTEESTECTSYNSALNTCNAGRSESIVGGVYLGAVPATTTAPVMLPTSCETAAGKPCEGFFLASDAEQDRLSFAVKTQPMNGSVTIDQDFKGYYFTPKPGFVGTDTFTVVADDTPNGPGGESAPVTITVTVK